MTHDDERDRELDAFLRRPIERIAPPDGSWETITRRARRRKRGKAALAVAAGVVILAGAVPAVIAVQHNSSNQSVQIGDGHHKTSRTGPSRPRTDAPTTTVPTPTTSTAVPAPAPTSLNGFTPTSVSFASPTHGFQWGSKGHYGNGVVAQTGDGGKTWTRLAAPAVAATDPGGSGDYGIRFVAGGRIGYVFGNQQFVTTNGGSSWTPVTVPGRVVDLETYNGVVWALVSSCATCDALHLYSASVSDPTQFARVAGIPALHAPNAVDGDGAYLAVHNTAVYVLVGTSPLWSSQDGVSWAQTPNPCPSSYSAAAISSWNTGAVAAACAGPRSAGDEPKQVYESTNAGSSWSALPSPPVGSYISSLSTGDANHVIIGVTAGPGYVTQDRGAQWSTTATGSVNLSFVGFISRRTVVGVPGPDVTDRAFLSSNDAGASWYIHRFPK